MHSPELDQLATALAAAQAEFTAIPKDSANPFFKSSYAGLPVVIKVASPILNSHGLSISQHISTTEDGQDTMTTYLLHSSGQFIAHAMRLHLSKDDPQGQGSAVTYARRYSYMAVLGLVADDDDDGNAASRPSKPAEDITPGVPEAVKAAVKSTSPKRKVEQDSRWQEIKNGAAADPSNTFLTDLVKKGEQYGDLTEKQLGAGFNAARKVLDAANPRAKDVVQAFPGATELRPGEEPF